MAKKSNSNIKSINLRMPSELHKVLKALSNYSDVSINRIIIESITLGVRDWAEGVLTEVVDDGLIESERQTILDQLDKTIGSIVKDIENYYVDKYGPD